MNRYFVAFVLTLAASLSADFGAEAETVEVVLVGDIMVDELPGEAIAEGIDPFAEFADIFKSADISIGNLECVVATGGARLDKKFTFRAHPRVLPVLQQHFTALSVANNHSGDFGKDALVEQFELFEKAGFAYFGGGRNFAAAHEPLILTRKGIRIAFLGYNEFKPRSFEAGPTTPGLAWSDDDAVIADIRRTKEKADLVIPYMHWGWEHEEANDRQKLLARKMIDAGAAAVVGNHPHVRQAIEYYNGRLIAYSLGNFVFNSFTTEESTTGWILRLRFSKTGLVDWDTKTVRLDDRGLPSLQRDAKSPSGRPDNSAIADYHPPYPKPDPVAK